MYAFVWRVKVRKWKTCPSPNKSQRPSSPSPDSLPAGAFVDGSDMAALLEALAQEVTEGQASQQSDTVQPGSIVGTVI